jgi:hypothetical protein
MNEPSAETSSPSISAPSAADEPGLPRRAILRKLGRYAAVTPPAVTLLLAATSKRAAAITSATSSRQLKDRIGDVDGVMLALALASVDNGAAIGAIDGVGLCLAAIKALSLRLDALEGGFRPALL